MDTVVMLDGGFVKRKFRQKYKRDIQPEDLDNISKKLIEYTFGKSVSYRVYYYDCPPIRDVVKRPLSNDVIDLAKGKSYQKLLKFINKVKCIPFFAVREGVLSFQGWKLDSKILKNNGENQIVVSDDNFTLDIKQKGVDTKIGLDIAWISFQRISQSIILVTGDSDFTPAIKTARRNGIFIHLYTFGHGVKPSLKENVDVLNEKDITNFVSNL